MKLLRFLFLDICLLSCGLNSYPYLREPDVRTVSPTGGKAVIINRPENDPDVFRGYEFYYKFYDSKNAESLQKKDHKAIFAIKNPDHSALRREGYIRARTVKEYDEETRHPMLLVPVNSRDESFEIEIDFAPLTADKSKEELMAKYKNGEKICGFYRDVKDDHPDPDEGSHGDKICKDFNSDDLNDKGDKDLPSGTEKFSLSMYVMSYGIYDNSYNIYSKPVWLGYVTCW